MLRTLVIVIALTGAARADDISYRASQVAADIGATIVFAGVTQEADDNAQHLAAVVPGMVAFGVSGTLVHLAHGNVRGAERSLLLRTVLPVAGGLAGWYLFRCGSHCSGREDGYPYAEQGVLVGELTAAAIDDLWFAHAVEQAPIAVPLEESYSRSLWLADLAGVTAVGAMLAMPVREPEPTAASLVGYLAFAPLTHLLHDNSRGAARSLALRVGLPLAGALLGQLAYINRCTSCDGSSNSTAALAVLGGLAAIVIDDAVFTNSASDHSPPVTPMIVPTNGGATAGISGAF